MEKEFDPDDEQDTSDMVKKYKDYPGSFYKQMTSADYNTTFSRFITITSAGLISDPCYIPIDPDPNPCAFYNYVNISTLLTTDADWPNLTKRFQFYKITGIKIEGNASCDSSPFSSYTTTRIVYPPLGVMLDFGTTFYPEVKYLQMVKNSTYSRIEANYDSQKICYALPDHILQTGTWVPVDYTLIYLRVYFGGYIYIPTLDTLGSEAYQVIITVYVSFKNNQ